MWSGERLTRKQLTSRPDHLWPELWKSMGKHAKLKEKQKWSNEKLHLENARKLRGIYFIDTEDKEFKETIKNARKKLETSVSLAMPCKIMKNCGSGASNKIKNKTCVYLGSWWIYAAAYGKFIYRIIMKTTLQEKVKIHYSTSIWYTNLFPCIKQWRDPHPKAAVDKEWEKHEKDSVVGTKQKVRKQIRGDRWSKKRRKESTLRLTDGPLSFEECRIGDKAPKIQRSSCTPPRRHCERWFWILCSIHWTRIISISNDGSKRWWRSYPDCQGAQDKQRMQYLLMPRSKWKMPQKLLKISKSECPDIWIRLPRHKWPKSWSSMEDPVVPSWKEFVRGIL